MSVKAEIDSINLVELSSSDDEGDDHVRPSKNRAPPPPTSHPIRTGESRSFWRAGSYDVVSAPTPTAKGQLEHARVHPKFLHSNATSHKWSFGAIAELLDNAVDEICNGATFVKVDRIYNNRDNSPALLFQDDGGGMDPECLRKCMSLGYSSKKNTTIGQYGNGFKTSTMRLGADVIVFSRKISGSHSTQSIGLLSYTFLRRTGQDDIIVPMVDFDVVDDRAQPIIYGSQDDWIDNFKIILEWSPFSSKEELMQQFDDIGSHGTKVIVFNLWLNDDGVYELDFDDDDEDIRLRDEVNLTSLSKSHKATAVQSHISYCMRYSLRAYTSILYLRKFSNFQIVLRGRPVQQLNIVDELKFWKVIPYRPNTGMSLKEVTVETTIGFVKEAPAPKVYGFNVYHKNRLIMPFWRVLNEGSSRGKGVVGVLEANFIEPAHNKQDFERTALFIRLEMRLKQMVLDYWKSHRHLIGLQTPKSGTQNTRKEYLSTEPHTGLANNLQPELPAGQPILGLAANIQNELHTAQPIIGLAAVSRNDSVSHNSPNIQEHVRRPTVGTTSAAEGAPEEVESMEFSGSALVDKICDENMQLFFRCEEHRRKELDLKQTIAKLESEIAEARQKCSQLASNLEAQRKQKAI